MISTLFDILLILLIEYVDDILLIEYVDDNDDDNNGDYHSSTTSYHHLQSKFVLVATIRCVSLMILLHRHKLYKTFMHYVVEY